MRTCSHGMLGHASKLMFPGYYLMKLRDNSYFQENWMIHVNIHLTPQLINTFINLSILNISHNNIHWLPDELCQLRYLQVFIVNDNSLTALPKHIGQLCMLKELKVCSNQLVSLPESMKLLKNLLYLGLYNNEFLQMDTVIPSIPNLLGLDLEQNYFSTDLLLIRSTSYDHLKTMLRHYWADDYVRLDGPKSDIWYDKDSDIWNSSLSLSNSSQNDILTDNNFLQSSNEENWDISEDSADDFDPNERPEPRKRNRSPFMLYRSLKPVFCPADIHQKRCIERLKEMVQQGSFSFLSEVAEGQFEDAEI